MFIYNLSEEKGPIYKTLYQFIREDIQQGKLKANEKIPSKRMLAKNLGISTISIENAYEQLISEGYIYTIHKKGYYVAELEKLNELKSIKKPVPVIKNISEKKELYKDFFDFSYN